MLISPNKKGDEKIWLRMREERKIPKLYLPVGGCLALAMKEKIWKGEFVDMFSLLQVEPEPIQKIGECLRDFETSRKRKIDKNWTT